MTVLQVSCHCVTLVNYEFISERVHFWDPVFILKCACELAQKNGLRHFLKHRHSSVLWFIKKICWCLVVRNESHKQHIFSQHRAFEKQGSSLRHDIIHCRLTKPPLQIKKQISFSWWLSHQQKAKDLSFIWHLNQGSNVISLDLFT